jgi:hypothetical protein
MYELLIRIETLCLEAQPLHLVGVGAVMTAVGLLLWLGGTHLNSMIMSIFAGIVGSFWGLLASQRFDLNALLCMSIGIAVFSIAAFIFKRFIVIVLITIVLALAAGTAYSSVVLSTPTEQQDSETSAAPVQSFSHMDPATRLAYFHEITGQEPSISGKLKAFLGDTLSTMSPHRWILLLFTLLGGIGGLLLIWLIKRPALAISYSVVGALLVLAGTESLLTAGGLQGCSILQEYRYGLTIIYFLMVGLGTIVQLFLTRSRKPKEQVDKLAGDVKKLKSQMRRYRLKAG